MDGKETTSRTKRHSRVALVGPAMPYRGGIAHFTNRLSQELAKLHEVCLLTFSRQYPRILFPGKTQTENTPWELPSQPARLIDSVRPGTWRRAGKWLAGNHADVILFSYWMPFFVPSYLGIIRSLRRRGERRPPLVLLLHNVAPHGRFPFGEVLLRRLLAACDVFVTLSASSTSELLERMPGARVHTAFHPIYDMFQPAVSEAEARRSLGLPEKRTLLFFGLIRRYKGLDLLVEALPAIRRSVDVQLVVAGEFYDDEAAIRQRVGELGMGQHVHFEAAYIPNERVHLYYSAADLVVQPYRSATQSGVTNIALHFGKPIVVTDVGGLAETVPDGEAGFVVPPGDVEALARAVERFFSLDPRRFSEGARKQATALSWERFAAQFDHILAESPDLPR